MTEMMLLEEDVIRIVGLGYEETSFTHTNQGFKILKNSSAGRCVFHDGNGCTIYENRPKGCKLYPIIFNENDMRSVKDHLCPFKNEFKISHKSRKEMADVYPKLLNERLDRIKKNKGEQGAEMLIKEK